MLHRPYQQRPLRDLIFWLPSFAGVVVLVAALIFISLRVFGRSDESIGLLPRPVAPVQQISPPSLPGQPGPPWPSSESGSSTGAQPADHTQPAGSTAGPLGGPINAPGARPPVETRPPQTAPPQTGPPQTKPPATGRPASLVAGTYRLMNSYDDAFIGEVLVTNSGKQDQTWTVVLRFPGTVGPLITSWVESAPQATLSKSGQTYTWRSGVPVPAGSGVPLRFHFTRSGTGNFPTTCTVNGSPCTIRR